MEKVIEHKNNGFTREKIVVDKGDEFRMPQGVFVYEGYGKGIVMGQLYTSYGVQYVEWPIWRFKNMLGITTFMECN